MFEINEAFASQAYAVSRDLGLDKDKSEYLRRRYLYRTSIGATGAVLTVKVMYELMRTDKKRCDDQYVYRWRTGNFHVLYKM